MSLKSRPVVGQLLVPYVVDERLVPIDFKHMHAGHVRKCADERRCGICGKVMRNGLPIAFIGPDDGRRCFADPWMHEACAKLAMEQCPFLRGARGWRGPAESERDLSAVYEHNMVLYVALHGRSHRDELGAWHFEALGQLRRVELAHTQEK
jgi:hypothetical protein